MRTGPLGWRVSRGRSAWAILADIHRIPGDFGAIVLTAATLGTAPYVCGPSGAPVPDSLVMASDPSMTYKTWANIPAFVASDPGTDLPAAFWYNGQDDGGPGQQIQADNAFCGVPTVDTHGYGTPPATISLQRMLLIASPAMPLPPDGAVSTMTVNITPRRMQNFTRANGVHVSCVVTPFGAGSSTVGMTVTNKLFTLPAVRINSTGPTTVDCS